MLRSYLTALHASIQADSHAVATQGHPEYGRAVEALYEAEQHLREQEGLLRLHPEEVALAIALCDAVARRRAIVAAIRDLEASDATGAALLDATQQHAAAMNALRAAVWAFCEGLR